jgi:chemotaxis protein CheX
MTPEAASSAPQGAQTTGQLIVHFVKSIQEVLATMAGVTVTVGKPCIKQTPAPLYDVSGIIGFSGHFSGSMVLSFSIETAAALVSAFAGATIPPESPDFADAVGELANMIAGSAKKSFTGDTSISLPSVIIGKNHSVARIHGVPCLLIPCSISAGQFVLEVCIKPS